MQQKISVVKIWQSIQLSKLPDTNYENFQVASVNNLCALITEPAYTLRYVLEALLYVIKVLNVEVEFGSKPPDCSALLS